MDLFLALFAGVVGIGSAIQLSRQKKLTRSYVLRSLGLVLLVYVIAGLLFWFGTLTW